LAKRLSRHGVCLSGGALATLLSEATASANMPLSLVGVTVNAASLVAAGQAAAAGVTSANVAAITERVVKAMLLNQLKVLCFLSLIVVSLGFAGLSIAPLAMRDALAQPQEKNSGQGVGAKPTVLTVPEFMSALAWDGKNLATATYAHEKASQNCTLRLWDVQKGQERVVFGSDPNSRMRSMAMSPDGKTLAVTIEPYDAVDLDSFRSSVRVVDVAKGEIKETIDFAGRPGGVAFSPDGKIVAFGGADTWKIDCDTLVVKLWNLDTNKEQGQIRWEAGVVQRMGTIGPSSLTSLAFSPDGKTLAVGQGDHRIMLFNLKSKKLSHTLEGHTDRISALTFAPDGRTLVSVGGDKKIQVWDPATGKLQRTLVGNKGQVHSVAFSPDSKTLATSGQILDEVNKKLKGEVLLWDVRSGETRCDLPEYEKTAPHMVAFSREGNTLAVGSTGKGKDGKVQSNVRVWQLSQLPPAPRKREK
jgi:WD40 repeat protein